MSIQTGLMRDAFRVRVGGIRRRPFNTYIRTVRRALEGTNEEEEEGRRLNHDISSPGDTLARTKTETTIYKNISKSYDTLYVYLFGTTEILHIYIYMYTYGRCTVDRSITRAQ